MKNLCTVAALWTLSLPVWAFAHSVTPMNGVSAHAEMSDGHGMGDMTLKTGRYAGQFRVNGNGRIIHAVMDLFYVQQGAEYPKLQASLKLVLGDYSSPEYVGYTYENVLFDPNSMLLSLDGAEQDITLSDVMAMGHSQMLMGKFQSASSGMDGTFDLRFIRSNDLPPANGASSDAASPIRTEATQSVVSSQGMGVEALAGEYQGHCDGRNAVLQIETERSRRREALTSDPFSQNQIIGTYGSADDATKWITIDSGTYDFFSGDLKLHGSPKSLSCQVSGNTLNCGDCKLTRSEGFSKLFSTPGSDAAPPYHERKFRLDRSQYPRIVGTPEASQIQGRYFGYLHHEQTDLYQPVSLNIVTAYHMSIPGSPLQLYIIPSVQLYFGAPGSEERIPYKFDRRPWLYTQGWMELNGNTEAYGVVREWRKGMVVMDWYSRNFGRVGTMELLKGKWPIVPSGIRMLGSVSGEYHGPVFDLSLQVGASDGTESEPFNPYYPLVINGATRVRSAGNVSQIESGVYDFYTGAFSFVNAYKNHLCGARMSDSKADLFVTGNNTLLYRLMRLHFDPYVKIGKAPSAYLK